MPTGASDELVGAEPADQILVAGSGDGDRLEPAQRGPAIRFGTAWHPINPGRAWLQHSGLPALRRESQRAGTSMPGIVPRIKFRPEAAPGSRSTQA